MDRFTEAELAAAKSIDLTAVATKLGYTVKRVGGIKCPDLDITPDLWKNELSTIWIKISNLEVYKSKSVNDFCFVNNQKRVSKILDSNCCFGYIEEMEKNNGRH